MTIVQARLRSDKEILTTWLDKRPDLQPGAHITLKDFKPKQLWRVEEVYITELDSKDLDFHRKWDNNNYDRHKGLRILK